MLSQLRDAVTCTWLCAWHVHGHRPAHTRTCARVRTFEHTHMAHIQMQQPYPHMTNCQRLFTHGTCANCRPYTRGRYILYHEPCAVFSNGSGLIPPEGMGDGSILRFYAHGESCYGVGLKCKLCGKRWEGGWPAVPAPAVPLGLNGACLVRQLSPCAGVHAEQPAHAAG